MLKLSQVAVALTCAFATLTAVAQGPDMVSDLKIPDIPYTKFELKNGLTVLVHEDHKVPVVAVNTWYHVGSKNEKPGKTGFAHLFEHLMFSGSANFNRTFISEMQRIGATDLNGTTNLDRTNYFETVPKSMLDVALFAESDRMGHLLDVLDQSKLDLQRGVVQNEKRQGENQPYGVTRQLLTENTYPVGHPYSWTTIGSMQDLDAASMADVKEWFKTYYGPNNVTLVLAGDITPDEARAKVEKYFGEIPPGPPLARPTAWIAKRTGTHRSVVQDRVPQARLYRVWNVPQANSAEEPQLDLLAQVLGVGKSSRLYKRLVYKEQLATDVNASDDTNEIAGQFRMIITAAPGADLHKIEKIADEELKNLLDKGPTTEELASAKNAIMAGFTRGMERVGGFGGKSDTLAACMTFTGSPECYKKYLSGVKSATPQTVRAQGKLWLSDGDYVLEVHPFPTALSAGEKLDRSKLPNGADPDAVKLPALQKFALSNGLQVVLAERHGAPLVNFSMLFEGGQSSNGPDKQGLLHMTMSLMQQGTHKRSALQLSDALERIGAQYGFGTSLDNADMRIDTLKANLPTALDLYADIITHPAFDEKEFERTKKELLARVGREKASPQGIAMKLLPELIYGTGHPYGQSISGFGTEATIQSMTRADLQQYYRTWLTPDNATLVVVGDITLAELKPQLEHAFGAWHVEAGAPKRSAINVEQLRREPVAASEVYLIDRPGSQQSFVVAAQLLAPMSDAHSDEVDMINEVFGSGFSGRINMNLREDKHWSYGVRNHIFASKGPRLSMVMAPVQGDKTRETMLELQKEFKGITGERPIAADELSVAQARETLSLAGQFETDESLAYGLRHILSFKLPDNYYDTRVQRIRAMKADELNALAQKTFKPGQLIWLVVGDMARIEQGIRDIKFGTVHKLDANGKRLD